MRHKIIPLIAVWGLGIALAFSLLSSNKNSPEKLLTQFANDLFIVVSLNQSTDHQGINLLMAEQFGAYFTTQGFEQAIANRVIARPSIFSYNYGCQYEVLSITLDEAEPLYYYLSMDVDVIAADNQRQTVTISGIFRLVKENSVYKISFIRIDGLNKIETSILNN